MCVHVHDLQQQHKDTTLDPNGTLKSGQDTPHSQDTPHPGQDTGSSPVVKEGAHEEELVPTPLC